MARRLRPATEPRKPIPAPARQPVAEPAATADLLYRYAVAPRHHGAPARDDVAGAERRRGHPGTVVPTRNRTPRPDAPTGVEHRPDATRPVPERKDVAPGPVSRGDVPVLPSDRGDLPVPVAPPTASERLGPAPLVTPSHPALVEPDPVGAPTIPVAGATLRQGAARDAEAQDFLDGAELTRRIAQVLRDEARRHGIEV